MRTHVWCSTIYLWFDLRSPAAQAPNTVQTVVVCSKAHLARNPSYAVCNLKCLLALAWTGPEVDAHWVFECTQSSLSTRTGDKGALRESNAASSTISNLIPISRNVPTCNTQQPMLVAVVQQAAVDIRRDSIKHIESRPRAGGRDAVSSAGCTACSRPDVTRGPSGREKPGMFRVASRTIQDQLELLSRTLSDTIRCAGLRVQASWRIVMSSCPSDSLSIP